MVVFVVCLSVFMCLWLFWGRLFVAEIQEDGGYVGMMLVGGGLYV